MYKNLPILKKALSPLYKGIPDNTIGIYGKLYNVKDFDHPGGKVFLEISLGTDATSLFETHHLNMKHAKKILENIPMVGTYEQINQYDYTSYRAYRDIVFKQFPTRESRSMSFDNRVCMYAIIFITIVAHIILLFQPLNYFWLPLCILSACLNTICGGYGHNAIHQLNPVSMFLDWNGLSGYEWLLEHIQSHHMHVNTEYDHDSVSMEPFLTWIPNRKKGFINKITFFMHVLFFFSENIVAINGIFIHRGRWKIVTNKDFPLWMRLAPFMFILRFLGHVVIMGTTGIITFVTTLCMAGYMFAYLAHLNHTYDKDVRPDFLAHQMANTKDIDTFLKAQYILFLDRQVLHHMFPSIDQTRFVNKKNGYSIEKLNKLMNKTLYNL